MNPRGLAKFRRSWTAFFEPGRFADYLLVAYGIGGGRSDLQKRPPRRRGASELFVDDGCS